MGKHNEKIKPVNFEELKSLFKYKVLLPSSSFFSQ